MEWPHHLMENLVVKNETVFITLSKFGSYNPIWAVLNFCNYEINHNAVSKMMVTNTINAISIEILNIDVNNYLSSVYYSKTKIKCCFKYRPCQILLYWCKLGLLSI